MGDNKIYAMIVYLTLITSGYKHWQESSPDYLMEKSAIPNMDERDYYGFGYLDGVNMNRALSYCKKWSLPVPPEWTAEARRQDEARFKLYDKMNDQAEQDEYNHSIDGQ